MNNINNVISDFENASINNGLAQEEGNANQANKFYRVIEKRRTWLIEHDELHNEKFLELLNHENDYVRLHAACALLHVENERALNTLSELTINKGILGFSAKMTISEYQKGHIWATNLIMKRIYRIVNVGSKEAFGIYKRVFF